MAEVASVAEESAPEALGNREVLIWHVRPSEVRAPELVDRYQRILSAEECERGNRFQFDRDRHSYLVTRVLVRTVLSHYTGVDPTAWGFEKNSYGRPSIAYPPSARRLRFNLSHTTDLIACCVARQREIGVDVESLERTNVRIELADRFFSPAEAADLRSRPAWRTRFFEYWTLKEAYIKARGMGLSLPIEKFTLDLREPRDIRIAFAPPLRDRPETLRFQLFDHLPGYMMALAFRIAREERVLVRVGPTVPPSFGEAPVSQIHEYIRPTAVGSVVIVPEGPRVFSDDEEWGAFPPLPPKS
ncbi:MAG: 4'-phosphopantetheinyl transferase superfamily protein [Candidatus Binatia bacterium]|nr:4'-phosphopantetheinyl transferase superfamily protein [Candidatus Binatia bacterium]